MFLIINSNLINVILIIAVVILTALFNIHWFSQAPIGNNLSEANIHSFGIVLRFCPRQQIWL